MNSKYSDLEAVKALDYLTKFNNEYHKAVIKKGDRKALHNTKKLRQDRYTANNARNRDLLSTQRFMFESLSPHSDENSSSIRVIQISCEETHRGLKSQEEVLVDLIDLKNKSPD